MRRSSYALPLILAGSLFAAGCSSSRLAEYEFKESTLAVVINQPGLPQVNTNSWLSFDPDNLFASAARAGAVIAKEASAGRAHERMMRAMRRVDIAGRVADRTLDRGAVYLHAVPVEHADAADYLMDIWIHEYGIHTDSWDSEVYFRMKADVILTDAATGKRIWKQRVKAKDPITAPVLVETFFDDILTAEALSRLSEEEMVIAFERLADATADKFAKELREDLRKARR